MKNIYIGIGAVLIVAVGGLIGSLAAPQLVHAAAGDITSAAPYNTNTRFALEQSGTTERITVTIPIYLEEGVSKRNTKININSFTRGRSTIGVKFAVKNGETLLAKATSGADSFTIPAGAFDEDTPTKRQKVIVVATMVGQGSGLASNKYVHFRLAIAAGTDRGDIAYGSGYTQEASVDYPDTSPKRDITLIMATPCGISGTSTKPITFYDLDNRGGDNGGGHITIKFSQKKSGGGWTTMSSIGNNGTLDADNYSNLTKNPPTGAMGQKGTFTMNFPFKENYKYQIVVKNISPNNVLGYNLYYDNIAYSMDCPFTPEPTVKTKVGSGSLNSNNKTALPGDNVTVRYIAKNAGPNKMSVDMKYKSKNNPNYDRWKLGEVNAGELAKNETDYKDKTAAVGDWANGTVLNFETTLKPKSSTALNTWLDSGVSKITVKNWSLSASTVVNKTEVESGGPASFTHKVINASGQSTATSIGSQVQWRKKNTSGNFVGSWTLKGSAMSGNIASSASRTHPTGDVRITGSNNEQYCERVRFNKKTAGTSSTTYAYSAEKCVKIVYKWSVSADTQLRIAGAQNGSTQIYDWGTTTRATKPGQFVNFRHMIKSAGPNPTNQIVKGVAIGFNAAAVPSNDPLISWATNRAVNTNTGWNQSWGNSSYQAITQSHVRDNTEYCQALRVTPASYNTAAIDSTKRCFTVPYDYQLTTQVGGGTPTVADPGAEIEVGGTISNAGPTKSRDNTIWELTTFRITKGSDASAKDKSGPHSANPCAFYVPHASTPACTKLSGGDGAVPTAGKGTGNTLYTIPADLAVGDKVCFALSVRDRAHNSTEWYHSKPVCITVGKKPKVQIQGGDLIVGRTTTKTDGEGKVKTSTSNIKVGEDTKTYGSWIEYAAFAKTIEGAGSAASYNDGSLNSALCYNSTLSFSNIPEGKSTCEDDKVGGYAFATTVPDIAAAFPDTATALSETAFTLDGRDAGTYTFSGDVTVQGAELGKGKSIILKAPGHTVTIASDITYKNEDDYANAGEFPQVVIIAKDVQIAQEVGTVDAWLISSGNLNTCSAVAVDAKLTDAVCTNKLTVNGPVVVQEKLYLRRTAGADGGVQAGDPAEIFNLRPDAYLWAYARAQGRTAPQTSYQTELPVRF